MNEILLVAGVFALVGAVLVTMLVRKRDFATYGAPEAAPAVSPGERVSSVATASMDA